MIDLNLYKTVPEVQKEVAQREIRMRKSRKLSQEKLSMLSGVSLASLKRFEQTGEISLRSLIKLSFALNDESSFDSLFSRKTYTSIEEVVRETQRHS